MALHPTLTRGAAGAALLLATAWLADAGPVKVTVREEKTVAVRPAAPLDLTPRIKYQPAGLSVRVTTTQNQTLHLSHYPTLKFDDQIIQLLGGVPGGRFEKMNAPLPAGPSGKARQGVQTVYVDNNMRITMTAELVPSRPAKGSSQRKLDTVFLRYEIENKTQQPRKIGFRAFMDVYVIQNDGALFAAPTMPGKVLNGIELKDKTLPDYVQLLEQPDLNNPGYVAHLTLDMGSKLEKANRVVLTSLGANNGWDVGIQQAGDSAMAVFWDPKEVPPGGKRDIAYAYGGGVAESPEPDGRFEVDLGGNFEPGKLFSITAHVHDPAPGQVLTLELPAGMQRVEGKEAQPVPVPLADLARSAVLWKGRALQHGEFPVRIRSSTGITQTKIIKIEPAGG